MSASEFGELFARAAQLFDLAAMFPLTFTVGSTTYCLSRKLPASSASSQTNANDTIESLDLSSGIGQQSVSGLLTSSGSRIRLRSVKPEYALRVCLPVIYLFIYLTNSIACAGVTSV